VTQPSSEIVKAARAAQAKYKVPASISLAQWALESGWGNHMPAGSNNPFGIKALPGQPHVTVPTREVDKYGRSITINAGFRKFESVAEAFDLHARLLATAPIYQPARDALPDPFAFADELTGRYATDPHYGSLLGSIMRGSNLTRYDA
jgi:flagellum-specific peptidoglycan hydrolase FlgJ